MAYLTVLPGDTERDSFNRSLYCGELPKESPVMGMMPDPGCGARDWRVFRALVYPPWTRMLVCQNCGKVVEVELPEEEKRLRPAAFTPFCKPENLREGEW